MSCCGQLAALCFFGFLCAGEFTMCPLFDPRIHLAVIDLQADALVDPTCFKIHIKCLKTDPFQRGGGGGCHIYVGQGNGSICLVVAIDNFLAVHGPVQGPLFCYADGCPLKRQLFLTVQSILPSLGCSGSHSGHNFCTGTTTKATAQESMITLSRL